MTSNGFSLFLLTLKNTLSVKGICKYSCHLTRYICFQIKHISQIKFGKKYGGVLGKNKIIIKFIDIFR